MLNNLITFINSMSPILKVLLASILIFIIIFLSMDIVKSTTKTVEKGKINLLQIILLIIFIAITIFIVSSY